MHRKRNNPRVTIRRADGTDAAMGRRIRSRRLDCGLSQTDLATKIGVTFQMVQKYENGASRVSASRLEKIGTALDMPVSYFFGSKLKAGPKSVSRDGESIFELLQTARAVRLLRAFHKIKGRKAQQAVIDLVEQFTKE